MDGQRRDVALYEFGVLAGRISALLRLSDTALNELIGTEAVANEEYGFHNRQLASSSVAGLSAAFSREFRCCIADMGLDTIDADVRIDFETLSVYFQSSQNGRIPLSAIGGQQNYVGYNIAALIAIHGAFIDADLPLIDHVLFIDQPSQAFFEIEGHSSIEQLSEESLARLDRLYRALDRAADRARGRLQIVVLERSPPRDIQRMPCSSIVADWAAEDHRLIPIAWMTGNAT